MRVLHIITGLAAGGAEEQLRLLVRHQGAAAEVAALTNLGSVARAIRAEGTVVHDAGMRGNTDLAALPRLVRLIRDGRFDVVHTHLYRSCVYGRVAARLAGVSHVVATEHSLGDHHIEGRRISPGIRRLYLATERLGTTTIAVSAAVARRLAAWGVPASRIEVIPNGIDLSRFRFDPAGRTCMRTRLNIPPGRFVVGSVGRLVRGKRTELILRALHGQPGVTAVIVGDGPERPALAALAADLHVDAIFTGESMDVPALLSTMDVLIAPSVEETFGLAIVEGVAAGLPVYYAAGPALDDLPAGSVPGAHRLRPEADAIRRALAIEIQHGPRRLAAPPVLDRFDMARIAGRVDDIYRRVTAGNQPIPSREEGRCPRWPTQ
ncbi:MAG TPA: glycosyltransferase [Actinoplanes sp.]|nr:glycosyltransferase [Actinoplanes sp.]